MSGDRDFIAPLLEALGALLAWFQATRVPGVIIGGVAASLLSKPRLTRDVDAVVLLGERSLEDFLKAGARFGIVPRLSNPLKFARQNRILLLIHSPSSVELDVSLGVMPFEEEMVSRAKVVVIQGIAIPVASPEDLIVMKALPMRTVDVRDIDSLLEVYPDLDKARVRHWVRQFAEVMEMPEMIDRLEMHLAPGKPRSLIRKSVRKPRGKGKK